MSLNSLIETTLQPTGVPVVFHFYQGEETTYIQYFELNESGALYADDTEQFTGRVFQVSVFSKGNYIDLVKQVKELLEGAGFTRATSRPENYEPDTGFYQKIYEFSYTH